MYFSLESDSTFTNVCSSVSLSGSKTPQQLEIIILHHSSLILHHSSCIILYSSFIILHSSFLHFATFKLFSLFTTIFTLENTLSPGTGPVPGFFLDAIASLGVGLPVSKHVKNLMV